MRLSLRLSVAVALCSFGVASHAASPILSLDFNRRASSDATNTALGFTPITINSNPTTTAIQTAATFRAVGPYSLAISNSAPNGYDDRLRSQALTNNAAFTDNLIYRDFIFSRDANGLGGLDITIGGLNPTLTYDVKMYSWDQQSPGTRVSDWYANGTQVIDNYTFDGRIYPTDNNQYTFTFSAMPDGAGNLLIAGRRDSTSVDASGLASFGVFVNALEVTPVPEPASLALIGLGLLGGWAVGRNRRR